MITTRTRQSQLTAPRSWCLAVLLTLVLAPAAGAQVPTPQEFFGFRMGADGELAGWRAIERYFSLVADRSDRVDLIDLGPTTEGRRTIAAVVSAPANLESIDAIRAANERLADPRGLAAEEAEALAAGHPAILAIGASIHSSEVGASQAANELLHELATAADPQSLHVLQSVVLLLIPSLNPDGHALVVDWHERTRDTPFRGTPMPWLYHKYVGHDINRDAFMLNMAENRNLARLFRSSWHPHVFLTMHQMGTRGPRFFVPPNYEPIDPNYDPIIWRQAGLLGHAMALRLERRNRSGVVSNALFDYYWPGYEDSAPLGHNTVCLLSEVASARGAFPLMVPPADLRGSPRGLPEYAPQLNFPNPWPGGTWRLRDIVEYNLDAMRGLLDGVARYRDELVLNFHAMARRAVERGTQEPPFAFLVPPEQHDPHATATLLDLLMASGVEVHRADTSFTAGATQYEAGTHIFPMAQPFRAYIKTLLERQKYPVRRLAPGAPPERPYDVTGWTLPLQMGVTVDRVDAPIDLPPMTRLASADVPPGDLAASGTPSAFIVGAPGTTGVLAATRLRDARLRPAWMTTVTDVDGRRFDVGALLVRATATAGETIERLVAELGVDAAALRDEPREPAIPVAQPHVGLYRPWLASIDEGWTRWLLEQYGLAFRTIRNADVRAGELRRTLDVVILPDIPPEQIATGHRAGTVPPEYAGGLGIDGAAALAVFAREGGTIVALDSSAAYVIDLLDLPVRDVVQNADPDAFLAPGTIVGLEVDTTHPLGFGLAPRTAAFFADSSAYEIVQAHTATGHAGATSSPAIEVVARYASDQVLLSGWLEGAGRIAGRPAVLNVPVGSGRAVLIGFRAQHRAQSLATFRLLFNAILTHQH